MNTLRKRCLLYLFCALSPLSGCGGTAGKEQAGGQLYYLDKQYTQLVPLAVEDKGLEGEEALEETLRQLAGEGIEEEDYLPPIEGFSLLGYEWKEKQLILNFSKEYRQLDSVREVLARAAMVKTLTKLEDVEYVIFQVNGDPLLDNLGMNVGAMNADTFIDNTDANMKNYEETELTLYFANAAGNGLVKVKRQLTYNINTAKEKLVVEQLIQGPLNVADGETDGLMPVLSPETKILGVNIKDGICYVNLDSRFLTPAGNANEDVVIYALVNSLTELPNVMKVQISVEGDSKILYREKYDLTALFESNYTLLQAAPEEGQ